MEKLGAAIVGCGNIAPNHADGIASSKDAYLYAVCDVAEGRADRLAERYSCKSIYSFEDLLSEDSVDSIHICTPHHLHSQMAIAAANAGKHIVLEKPVGLNLAQAIQVYEAVRKCGVRCCVSLQNRLNPSVVKAYEIVSGGSIGKMLGIKGILTWRRTREYYLSDDWRGKWATEGGGLLINQAIHMLDLLCYLGGAVDTVKANIDTRVLGDVIEVEDTADATLYYSDGKTGVFYATNGNYVNSPFHIEMYFEQGMLRYMDDMLTLYVKGEQPVMLANDSAANPGKAYWGSGHKLLIQGFYESLKSGGSYVDIEDALPATALLDAIYTSASKNAKVYIKQRK